MQYRVPHPHPTLPGLSLFLTKWNLDLNQNSIWDLQSYLLSFISWIPALSQLGLNPMHFGRNYTGTVNKPGMGVAGGSTAGSPRERVAKDQELNLWPESA